MKLNKPDKAYDDFITAEKLGHPYAGETIKAFISDKVKPEP